MSKFSTQNHFRKSKMQTEVQTIFSKLHPEGRQLCCKTNFLFSNTIYLIKCYRHKQYTVVTFTNRM